MLAALLIVGTVLLLDWPWWMGIFVFLGLAGICAGLFFIKKLWTRKREQQFIHQVIEQDEAYLKDLGEKEKENLKEVQNRWKDAVDALKHSHLKKFGNPLYVLPWYMIIGESGSGKTTAIESARLSSPFAEVSRTSGLSGTRNCDWWFFEQAVLIDTAGRYTVPVAKDRDTDEWNIFLTQLAKFRKKEPLNGLVITLAADKLLTAAPETIEEDGRKIRRRIDELMRVLGAKFPVYILVTKCDLIQGMTQFCNSLPDNALEQAMGLINPDFKADVGSFFERAIHTIGERLRDLRLLLFHHSGTRLKTQGIDPGLLLFPEEFEKIKNGISCFFKAAFKENPYQESPILRGLFFSSGRQEGSPYSHFLKELGLIEEREVLPGTNKGLFLHDFFSKILPKDRKLFAPTQRTIEWDKFTKNIGITSWIAIAITLCGLMSFSFVKNLRTLKEVSHEFSKPLILRGDILEDLIVMDRFHKAIVKVENQNRNWWIPRFGLTESIKVQKNLKNHYCTQFRGGFLASADSRMDTQMTRFSNLTKDRLIAEYCVHLVRRINLLNARLSGEDIETLENRPQPSYNTIALASDQQLLPEIKNRFKRLYLYYLIWQKDTVLLNKEMTERHTWLKHVLAIKGSDLKWLVTMANNDPALSSVTLKDFWGITPGELQYRTIHKAFTVPGKQYIDSFVTEMESALFDPLLIARKKLEFKPWYAESYMDEWHKFGVIFPTGKDNLEDKRQWQKTIIRISKKTGPYFSLLDRMSKELEPFAKNKDLPKWVKLVFEFEKIKQKSLLVKIDDTKKSGILGKAASRIKSRVSNVESRLGQKGNETVDLESMLISARAFALYDNSIVDLTPVASSGRVAYQNAIKMYSDDPYASESPFFSAANGLSALKNSLGDFESEQGMFRNLVSGPLDLLHEYIINETSCRLQDIWNKDVFLEVQGAYGTRNAYNLLFGEKGYVIKFIKGPAAPFISRSLRKGYNPKKVNGKSIPFTQSFFSFLRKGDKSSIPVQSNYAVSIKGLPTNVNIEAILRPHATRLELQCQEKKTSLINLNYPVKKTFFWSPVNCGDVVFKIEIGNLVLTKKYTGYNAFPKFLKDFAKGEHIFYPGNFPDKKVDLKRMGVKYIKAKYQFRNHRPVIRLLGTAIGRIPQEIVKCWDR